LLDALYADGPTLRALKAEQFRYFITIKEGYVLLQAQRLEEQGKLEELLWYEGNSRCTARWAPARTAEIRFDSRCCVTEADSGGAVRHLKVSSFSV
jgi:hypothetical protein